jgi:glycolate oxidase FAD binding subunit
MDTQIKQWSEFLRDACATGRKLRIRGGGSKDFYGQSFAGEVFSTQAYAGVISYEPSELVITVRAGTPLAEIEALLSQHGQCFPFEPPQFGADPVSCVSTVGGMVAAGLAGPARAVVGTVRDFVLGARMLNGRGEDLTFGGQVMKNVAGYDVSRLVAASMGQLGLITEVSLKVLPVAPAQATLLCEGLNQTQALELLHRWGGQPLPLNASVWHGQVLSVRLHGAVAAVKAGVSKMQMQAREAGASRTEVIEQTTLWDGLTRQTHAFFNPPAPDACLWRLSVPQTVTDLTQHGVTQETLIEWQGAQRWIWARAQEASHLRAALARLGGHATLFRTSASGGEQDRAVGVFTALSAVQQRIQEGLMRQFDPAGIFNPSRYLTHSSEGQ